MSETTAPEGWQNVQFGDVVTFTRKPRGLTYSEFDEVSFVPMDLVPIGQTYSDTCEIREGAAVKSGTYFEEGDILLARITPSFENGKQVVIEGLTSGFGVGSTEIIPFKAKSGVSCREYLFYYLLRSGVRSGLAEKMEGSTGRQRLKPRTLKQLSVSLPPLEEQQAISVAVRVVETSILSRIEERQVEQERKQALLDFLVYHGSRRGDEPTEGAKSSPVDWREKALEYVSNVAYGLTVNRSRRESESQLPYLRVANVNRGNFDLDEIKEIGVTEGDEIRYRVLRDDILIIEGNGNPYLLGSAAIWQDQIPLVLHQNHLIRVRVEDSDVLPLWVMHYINSASGRAQIFSRVKTSSGLHTINSGIIKSIMLPIPSVEEQEEIVGILEAADRKVEALDEEIRLYRELFQVLLEDLTTGQRSSLPLLEAQLEVAA